MTTRKTLFWFRQDLRLHDNPGLTAAVQNGSILPIYIYDPDLQLGAASQCWLHHSLRALSTSLNNKLQVYIGKSKDVITRVVQSQNIDSVYWNRCYEPKRIQADTEIKDFLKQSNKNCHSFNASLLWEPWEVLKQDGKPYKVFTPFYRNGCAHAQPPRKPLPKPQNIAFLTDEQNTLTIEQLPLLPQQKWYQKFEAHWNVGEKNATEALQKFLTHKLLGYEEKRNIPYLQHTSRLSPHLHFGEISPNQIWYQAQAVMPNSSDLDCFLSELGWREFAHYLLYHFPHVVDTNLQSKFDAFPWQNNPEFLHAWQTGQTGYPLVDAGMRELWQTGYMHNRVRMLVGSFLVKNLQIHWEHGAKWFEDCLVDADLANNRISWQWVAGTGVDAAPYFRVFNPDLQAKKFDPQERYIRQFLPQLKSIKPIVPLAFSRDQALRAYRKLTP